MVLIASGSIPHWELPKNRPNKTNFKGRHTIKAIWNDKVIAVADKKDLIYIEANWYFPPEAVNKDYLTPNGQHTNCFWKGEASYYNINVNDVEGMGVAWYYPKPMAAAIDRVGKDFTNYVAFWRGVGVS